MSASEMDQEANAFACALLMPRDWLLADIEAMGGIDCDDNAAVSRLAKKYRVTSAQMILRIGEIMWRAE